jgi:DeoR/GlpR family transcriptional regulator of sugar metabolism
MINGERVQFILSQLHLHGVVNTADLAQQMGVTEMTVRRDLESMEKQKLLIRVHGGAKLDEQNGRMVRMSDEKSMPERTEYAREKMLAAEAAAAVVEDGSCIFLDGGTSIAAMVPFLKGKHLRIVTHSILVANSFHDDSSSLYLLGGKYIPKYAMSVGPITLESLRQFHFDSAFIGCLGLDLAEQTTYTAEIETMQVKEAATNVSMASYLLADSSKLSVKGFFRSLPTNRFDKIFLNEPDQMPDGPTPANITFLKN